MDFCCCRFFILVFPRASNTTCSCNSSSSSCSCLLKNTSMHNRTISSISCFSPRPMFSMMNGIRCCGDGCGGCCFSLDDDGSISRRFCLRISALFPQFSWKFSNIFSWNAKFGAVNFLLPSNIVAVVVEGEGTISFSLDIVGEAQDGNTLRGEEKQAVAWMMHVLKM